MKSPTVQLPPTHPGAPGSPPNMDPRAVGYAVGVSARRGPGLPKYANPVGGEPTPPIPALEQPHRSGASMAAQAHNTRGDDSQRHIAQAQMTRAPGSIIVPESTAASPQLPQNLHLLPSDMLPPAALEDPQCPKGAGNRIAQHVPQMAAKYGVIRNGVHLSPQELRAPQLQQAPRARRTGADVARDLQHVLSASAQPPVQEGPNPPAGFPKTTEEAEKQAAGGAAAFAGQSPSTTPESEAKLLQAVNALDDFDFERLRREMLSDILKNPRQRELIEKRLTPLDIGDLITNNKIRQRVPILPGKLEPTFESMPGDVELALKQLLIKETKAIAVTEAYLMDKYAVMTTAAGVVAINGNPAPPIYDSAGDFSEEKFWEKFRWLLKQNIHLLASLGVNYSWFEQRVRKLFVAEEGKDG